MSREIITSVVVALLACIAVTLFAPPAQAGPPLVCWPFDIGNAKSLPWGGSSWHDSLPGYDTKQLAGDTLALLALDAPVLVRMETLRRAAIYSQRDPKAAKELFSRLEERAESAKSPDKPDPLALFDWGYFAETYRQVAGPSSLELAAKVDGYKVIQRALGLRGPDPQMEFAAALVAWAAGQRGVSEKRLVNAAAGAADGSLLAKNLVTHCHLFQMHADTLTALRTQLVAMRK